MTASRVQFGGGAPRGSAAAAVCENAAAPSAALLRAPRFSGAPLLALATRCRRTKKKTSSSSLLWRLRAARVEMKHL